MPWSRHKAKQIGGDKIFALRSTWTIYILPKLFRAGKRVVLEFTHFILKTNLVRISYASDPDWQGSGSRARVDWLEILTQDLNICPSPGPAPWVIVIGTHFPHTQPHLINPTPDSKASANFKKWWLLSITQESELTFLGSESDHLEGATSSLKWKRKYLVLSYFCLR